MILKELLKDIEYNLIQGDLNREFDSIAYDSRQIQSKGLFVCIEGYVSDGHNYIPDDLTKGATSIIVNKEVKNINSDITVIKVEDTRKALAYIASAFTDIQQIKLPLQV